MDVPNFEADPKQFRAAVAQACGDEHLKATRMDLMRYSGDEAKKIGSILFMQGYIIGGDRKKNASPFGNGSDEVVGVSVILRVLSELALGSVCLFEQRLVYAASALLRQLVEVEYLSWAIETRDKDAERWLRSDDAARGQFFRPSKLLKAAGEGCFRGIDYGFHCKYGGHPTPSAQMLLSATQETTEIFVVDALGHVGRVFDHIARWSRKTDNALFLQVYPSLADRFMAWKAVDLLAHLPAPPPEAMGMA